MIPLAQQTVEPEMVPELMAEVVMWEMEMLRIYEGNSNEFRNSTSNLNCNNLLNLNKRMILSMHVKKRGRYYEIQTMH